MRTFWKKHLKIANRCTWSPRILILLMRIRDFVFLEVVEFLQTLCEPLKSEDFDLSVFRSHRAFAT